MSGSPVLEKTLSAPASTGRVPTKTMNMSWSPDIETSFRQNVQFSHEKTMKMSGSTDIESIFRQNVELWYTKD